MEEALGDPIDPLEWAGVVLDCLPDSHVYDQGPGRVESAKWTRGLSLSRRPVLGFGLLWLVIAHISCFRAIV